MMDACEAWKNAVTDAKLAWYQHIAEQVESDGSINSPDWDAFNRIKPSTHVVVDDVCDANGSPPLNKQAGANNTAAYFASNSYLSADPRDDAMLRRCIASASLHPYPDPDFSPIALPNDHDAPANADTNHSLHLLRCLSAPN